MPGPDCPDLFSAVLTGRKFCLEENKACKTGGMHRSFCVSHKQGREMPRAPLSSGCLSALGAWTEACCASGWLKAENGQNVGSPSSLPGDPAESLAFVLQSSIFP